MSPLVLLLLGAACALVGSVGGIGGATLLVPVLIALDVDPLAAAPLGLLAVGAGSLAAAGRQIDDGLVHHRLGLTIELTAAVGTVGGALASTAVPEEWLARVLGVAAVIGGVAALSRSGTRNSPNTIFDAEPGGEWPGTLGGQYRLSGQMVPYQAKRVGPGLVVSAVAGIIAGLSGVGGGFVKTPAMSEVMHVPVKVAGATTTFTLGLTASSGLMIYALQGRMELHDGASVVAGALLGGWVGARLQSRLQASVVRQLTGVLLLLVAVVVIGRSL